MQVLVVDNYDSFVFNLVQYLGQLGVHAEVWRNDDDRLAADVAEQRRPGAVVRRVERLLPVEYRGLVEKSLVGLSPETYERAVKLAGLPHLIRGYEDIKLRNVQRFRDEVRALGF